MCPCRPLALELVEQGAGGTWEVVLAAAPSAGTVTVEAAASSAALRVIPSRLAFTGASWDVARTVTVYAGPDDDASDETATVSHTVTHTGGAREYDGLAVDDVTVTVTDDDAPDLALVWAGDPDPLRVGEGAAATYTVALATQPTGPVTVAVASSDTGAATVAPGALEFTPSSWNVAQTVTVTGVDDDDGVDATATLTHAASGADYDGVEAALDVAVADDDPPGVPVSPTSLALDEGAGAPYTVVLATEPSGGTVTVAVASSDPAVSVDKSSLTFSVDDWNVAQTVTVIAVADDNATGERAVVTHTVTHTGGAAEYDGLDVADVTVTVADDDAPALVLPAGPLRVGEGASATYEVALRTRPAGPVTVAVVSDDTGAVTVAVDSGVEPASLEFTEDDWNVAQTVTVTGVDDEDAGDETVTVTHTASGADYAAVRATLGVEVADDDTAEVTVSPESLALDEDRSADLARDLHRGARDRAERGHGAGGGRLERHRAR